MRRGYSEGLIELFRRMLLIRRFEETAIDLRVDDLVHGVIHPYIGQEAVAVGVCAALGEQDRIVSTHRGHGHCIAKGARVDRMMAELFGRADGYCRGKGGSMHIAAFEIGMLGANGIVGGGLPIALGSALAAKMDYSDTVTVAFFGDGATGEGSFHESLNLAALWKLPLIWVCENNQYASDTPVDRSIATRNVADFAAGFAIPGIIVDGNDVEAVNDVTRIAVQRALDGGGPTLIEAKTFRGRMHATRQKLPRETRPASLIEHWGARDPIVLFETSLIERQAASAGGLDRVRQDVEAMIDDAVAFATSSPYPEVSTALEDVWAPTP